ncbi:MAG: lysylphosphatidylglycerol synthase transmembrane domain-containing protein, partial [Acidimicrobiales bacterium]
LVGGIAIVVPKIRRAVISRLAPRLAPAWSNVRLISRSPGKLARIFGGAAVTQLMMALGLGFALFAVHASAPFGGLLIVCTFTALVGGMAPVPGGMGVMEASYISGLGLLGVPQDQAIAATLLYRACTTYLPPLWGWGALVWLRRHDAL